MKLIFSPDLLNKLDNMRGQRDLSSCFVLYDQIMLWSSDEINCWFEMNLLLLDDKNDMLIRLRDENSALCEKVSDLNSKIDDLVLFVQW